MGFRTVVILSNDLTDTWSKDPELGAKIEHASHYVRHNSHENKFRGGAVVQCCHADQQSLVVLDGYTLDEASDKHWERDESKESVKLRLVRYAADALGFRLVKKTVK